MTIIRFCDTERGSGSVYLHKGASKGFGSGSPTQLFCENYIDSILIEQRSKINNKFETTFACCRCKCNMLNEYGEKLSRPIIVVLTTTNIHSSQKSQSLHFLY